MGALTGALIGAASTKPGDNSGSEIMQTSEATNGGSNGVVERNIILTVDNGEQSWRNPYSPYAFDDNCVRIPKWRWYGEETFGIAGKAGTATITRCHYELGYLRTCYDTYGQEILGWRELIVGKWYPYIDQLSGQKITGYITIRGYWCPSEPAHIIPHR